MWSSVLTKKSIRKQNTQISENEKKKFSQKIGIFSHMFSRNETFCQVLPGEQIIHKKKAFQRNLIIVVILLTVISIQPLNSKDNKRILFTVIGLPVKRVPQIRTNNKNTKVELTSFDAVQ
jgi:hypothetical protein